MLFRCCDNIITFQTSSIVRFRKSIINVKHSVSGFDVLFYYYTSIRILYALICYWFFKFVKKRFI